MNTNKLNDLKKKIKHYTPEIIVGVSCVVGVATLLYFKNTSRLHANIPKETLDYVRESGDHLLFETKSGNFTLTAVPNN